MGATSRPVRSSGASPSSRASPAARHTSLRAVETWRAAAEAFPGEIPMQEDQGLYAASATRLAAAVEDASAGGAKVILMVGHNPGIHQYAVHLARQAGASDRATRPLYERFPTGSAAVFAVKGGRPAFETLLLVRDYRDKQA